MQDYLNNFYDILGKKVFNIDKHRFEIKKEFVSKAGIWIAKKRYAQWIISDNGVPVDKLDVKGLDVVRSSYPAAFRKFMSEVLIEILRGDTETQLTDKIYTFKKDLVNMDVVKIAKAGAVKELSKYLPKKKDQTAMFQFKSATPAHVKAAIAYNQLLTHFGLQNQYEPLKDGDKIKWVYLKQNPYGLDGVAMNGYNDPKEIMDLVTTYIDYDKIFERELLKKLEDFYGALNWGEVLSSTKTAEKFFSF
jgi:DNA polymerase elongation subunit (family B)